MSRRCSHCAHVNHDREGLAAKFCARCGRPLDDGITSPPPRYRTGPEQIGLEKHPDIPGRLDGMAVSAMVCGIVGLFMPIVGIVALILGIKSNDRIVNSNGLFTGRPMAIAGIVCGSLALLGHLGFCCAVIGRMA